MFINQHNCFSQIRIPETSCFGGYILTGVGGFDAESNLLVTGPPLTSDVGNAITTSIYSTANANNSLAIPLAGEVNYTFAKSKTQIFLGNGLEDVLRLDVPVGIGVRQQLKNGSQLMLRILTTPLTLKFWEDPYVEGETRERTRLNFNGLRFRWYRLLKSPLEFTATIRKYNYENERSGEWLFNQGRLTSQQQDLLNRNGFVYRFQLLYQFKLKQGQFLRPSIQYIYDDHEGKAIANRGYAIQLGYVKQSPKFIIESRLLFGQRLALDTHPIYSDTIDSYRYGGAVSIFIPIKDFFGSKRWNFWISGDYIRENNDIRFFDSRIFGIMGGLMYRYNRR